MMPAIQNSAQIVAERLPYHPIKMNWQTPKVPTRRMPIVAGRRRCCFRLVHRYTMTMKHKTARGHANTNNQPLPVYACKFSSKDFTMPGIPSNPEKKAYTPATEQTNAAEKQK